MMQSFSRYEVASALRNREMPLEALAADVTPTGLHYLIAHFDIPFVDVETWELRIAGAVQTELRLTLDDLRSRPTATLVVTLECAGNGRALMEPRHEGQPWHLGGVSTARWSGVRLADLLAEAGASPDAVTVRCTGIDEGIEDGIRQSYECGLPIEEARRADVLLATEMNGRPLEPQHGFPLRLLVPGWYGMASVKWLRAITVMLEPFHGPQHATYRLVQTEDDPGTPLSRIAPRALLRPPGIPDDDLVRVIGLDPIELTGRAWSGAGPIVGVEVSVDGGATWHEAEIDPGESPSAWRSFRFTWQPAKTGATELRCRARDERGGTQPDEASWNLWGFANNAVQRVPVRVEG
jgi:DMSO/TMAO reductase YedYZ molybdopterin-dependent catalytic subunit